MLSSRGLYHSAVKEQQQKPSVTKKLLTTEVKPGSVHCAQPGTERGADAGQPHAGQGSDATWVRKHLMSEMDTPREEKEVCIGHSNHLCSSPSAPYNTQCPVRGHTPLPGQWKAALLPEGRAEGSVLLLTPQLGAAPTPGSWRSFGPGHWSVPRCTAAQQHVTVQQPAPR